MFLDCFIILSKHLNGETDENHNSHDNISLSEIRTRDTPNMKQKFWPVGTVVLL